jgi:hypothetical protein
MRRYGTEILADPLMQTPIDDDISLVDFYIPEEGVEENIKRVKPKSLRFSTILENEGLIMIMENESLTIDDNNTSMSGMDVFQSSSPELSKGMGVEESNMEDSSMHLLHDEEEDYSDEDDEDAKLKESLIYGLGGLAFFTFMSLMTKKLLSCFGRVSQGVENDLDMVVGNADRLIDLAHAGETVLDATNASMSASFHSTSNATAGAIGGAANPASSATAAQ